GRTKREQQPARMKTRAQQSRDASHSENTRSRKNDNCKETAGEKVEFRGMVALRGHRPDDRQSTDAEQRKVQNHCGFHRSNVSLQRTVCVRWRVACQIVRLLRAIAALDAFARSSATTAKSRWIRAIRRIGRSTARP